MQQPFDEACRLVALRLAQAREMQEYQSVVFSSASPGDGTTAIVSEVARQLHSTFGLKPLIARLQPNSPPSWWRRRWRKPKPHNAPNDQNGRAGSVVVVPPGNGVDHSIGPFLKEVCKLVPEKFDFLLVDAPPMLAAGESIQAAVVIPRMVLVVESGRTQTETLDRIQTQLATFHVTLIGTVLKQNYNPIPAWMDRWLSR